MLEKANVTSLDGERKIARDKRAETQKMTSISRASRASIVQEYRRQRISVIAEMKSAQTCNQLSKFVRSMFATMPV